MNNQTITRIKHRNKILKLNRKTYINIININYMRAPMSSKSHFFILKDLLPHSL